MKPNVLEVLRNLGAAEVRSQHWVDGARHLQRWLRESTKETLDERYASERLLRTAQEHLGRLRIRVDEDGADVTVVGVLVGRTPLGDDVYVEPGPHLVRAEKGNRSSFDNTSVPESGQSYVPLELKPEVPHAPMLAASMGRPVRQVMPRKARASDEGLATFERTSSVLLIGGGLTLTALGGGLAFRRASQRADENYQQFEALFWKKYALQAPCLNATAEVAVDCDAVGDASSERHAYDDAAVIGFASAALLTVGTSVTLFLMPKSESHSATSRSWSLAPALIGVGLSAAGVAAGFSFLSAADSSRERAVAIKAAVPGGISCSPGSPNVAQCGKLFRAVNEQQKNNELATVGFTVAATEALGIITYLLWPIARTPSDLESRAAVVVGPGTITVHGKF